MKHVSPQSLWPSRSFCSRAISFPRQDRNGWLLGFVRAVEFGLSSNRRFDGFGFHPENEALVCLAGRKKGGAS